MASRATLVLTLPATGVAFLGYSAAIVTAELLVSAVNPIGGFAVHALLLVALLVHATLADPVPTRGAFVALAFLPMIRIVSLALALPELDRLAWYALMGAPLLAAIGMALWELRLGLRDIGLAAAPWAPQVVIAYAGAPLGVALYFAGAPGPLVQSLDPALMAAAALILLVFVAFVEEVIFRGFVQREAIAILGGAGIMAGPVLFAAAHLATLSAAVVVLMWITGVAFSLAVRATGVLWGVIAARAIMLAVALIVMPLVWPIMAG